MAGLAAVYALCLLPAAQILTGEALILPAAGFALAAAVPVACLRRHRPAPRLGPANAVTLARLALMSLFLAPLVRPDLLEGGTGWGFLALALFTLALDGVDGCLARRTGLAGAWGARFDMEADAAFALLLAGVAWRSGGLGAWVLLLGGMRYLFVAAALAWPPLGAPLPESRARKTVCVIQIATLALLLAPPVAPPWSQAAAAAALGLLGWSFARDILWLAARR
ncbi:CDP-alcohol phosphatidyltransferase family protein [Mangrovicoccus sp. HB182678]|uniref:CDP-alcohol phosphatidyltransferase family protein n=2 Tax=Mangrovicoccus algicola TaxID=2771008 RepID=A0A8J7CVC6_9RHOB|nr:CDP-alcohol phosphatidyltransferase family protein [Mangrovicoccus algicola]